MYIEIMPLGSVPSGDAKQIISGPWKAIE